MAVGGDNAAALSFINKKRQIFTNHLKKFNLNKYLASYEGA